MVSEQPTSVRVKLVAFLLSAEQLGGIEDWNPHTHVNAETITNGQVEQVLLCTHPDTDSHMPGVCDYTCRENIVFKGRSTCHLPLTYFLKSPRPCTQQSLDVLQANRNLSAGCTDLL